MQRNRKVWLTHRHTKRTVTERGPQGSLNFGLARQRLYLSYYKYVQIISKNKRQPHLKLKYDNISSNTEYQ